MGNYTSVEIKCPFYVRHENKTSTITCEGMLPGSSVKSHLRSGEALRGQIARHCAGDYKRCPWYRVLWGKYEET